MQQTERGNNKAVIIRLQIIQMHNARSPPRDCRKKLSRAIRRGRHATAMCNPEFVRQIKERSPQGNETICVCASCSGARSESKFSDEIYIQTFKAFFLTNAGSCCVKGIIDGGSQRTFIKEEVAQRLGLRVLRGNKIALNTSPRNASKAIERSFVAENRA